MKNNFSLPINKMIMRLIFLLAFLPFTVSAQNENSNEVLRWKKLAASVNIVRDNWGVAHVYSKTDAGAVFGLLYAQCEENFKKVEENNLEMLGRLSELYGEKQLYNDLEMRMIYDTAAAVKDYRASPPWLHKLLDAAADGVNFYLYKHPEVKPAVLSRFEPWYALLRTNGSISATQNGGITTADMKELYPAERDGTAYLSKRILSIDEEPTGSNGFAAGPSKTKSHNAILYINPHVTFYFRSEAQMVSEEGLNAYGGVTWGTFFIFQGFNEHCGWMHTSGAADVADLFIETVVERNGKMFTKYDSDLIPVQTKPITIRYKRENGFGEKTFKTYYSKHGPVLGSRNGKWLSLREHNRSINALIQSWMRTKAKGFEDFKNNMNRRSNTSDNTVFADDKGNIAYWHGNFVPVRNIKYDYSLPVDGSISQTDWKGIFPVEKTVHLYNPSTGFIQNCNSTPFTVSGTASPKKENYPIYMAPDGENFRGINAAKLMSNANDLTIETMISNVGYDHHLSFFDTLLPVIKNDFENLPATDSLKNSLSEAINILSAWDKNSAEHSVATTIAVEFAYRLLQQFKVPANAYAATHAVEQMHDFISQTNASFRLNILAQTLDDLTKRFGLWKTEWGIVNRYQRSVSGNFSDDKESFPSGLAAATFGSLPSFGSIRFNGSNKRYGVLGNSFVACVEFGKKVKAKSVITGGQSFDPANKHFLDQAEMYLNGKFKAVLFYKEDVMQHAERKYHPGE
jgi:acyl-homoserine-lactone acylase